MGKLVICLSIFTLCGCSRIKDLYNDFSYSKTVRDAVTTDGVIRIYFDRWGDIYPSVAIDHNTFVQHSSVFEQVYKDKNLDFLDQIMISEGLHDDGADVEVKLKLLENKLAQKYANQINTQGASKKVIFLIHGYNNNPDESFGNYEKLRFEVLQRKPSNSFQFVEIYWDGLSNVGKSLNTFKIWDNAQVSSSFAGLGLRRVLNKLNCSEVYVITHSHGAAVITEALFNVRRFKKSYYICDSTGIEIAKIQNDFKIYSTPVIRFHVGMLAPAIPGVFVFRNYNFRTTNSGNIRTAVNNYSFISGFNSNDKATKKEIFSGQFGATTLGCRENENSLVKKNSFALHPEDFTPVDFSLSGGEKQISHDLVEYIKNPKFVGFLNTLLETN